MSKTNRKFNQNFDYFDDYEESYQPKRVNKSKIKRIDRALKVKDIDLLCDEDYFEEDY